MTGFALTDECGSGPYEALVIVEDSRLVDVPAILFAHLEEPPREGLVFGCEGVNVKLLERKPANREKVSVEWVWSGRMVAQ